MPTSDRPVLIVGAARSGTTMLQLMIHAHPRLAMPPENRFVMPVYDKRLQFGDPATEEARAAVASFIVDRRKSKLHDLRLDGEVVRERIRQAPATIGSFLGVTLEEYARANDRARWGDKRPNYIQRLDDVVELFPDAQILHIVRDGRDSVASLKRMPWWKHGTVPAIHKWVHAIRCGQWAREHLPADQFHEFRYEDLVADPAAVLRAVCDFLEEDFDEAMLEPHRIADEGVPDYKRWHEKTRQPVSASSVGSWRDGGLEPDEVRLLEHVAGPELALHGYEPSIGRLRRRPRRSELRTYRAFLERRRVKDEEQARQRQRRRDEYPWPVAARLTSRQRELATIS